MSNPNLDQSSLFLLVQQLQQEVQNQRVEISHSDLILTHRAPAYISELQLRSATPPSRSRLPDPPRFDGKPLTLRTWLPSIRAKLRSDQLSGADAFDYVWDRLEQPQQASVLHLRHQAEENNTEQQEAIQRFSLVRQRDEESLIAYLARFERLAYEAGASTWPDTSRISVLHRGLRSSLRQSLEESNDSLFTIPYDEYVELVQSLDRRSRRPQPPQQPKQVSRQLDPMDVDPIKFSPHEYPRSVNQPAASAPAVLAAPALANYAPTISALTALTPAAFTLNAPTPTVTALIAATLNALALTAIALATLAILATTTVPAVANLASIAILTATTLLLLLFSLLVTPSLLPPLKLLPLLLLLFLLLLLLRLLLLRPALATLTPTALTPPHSAILPITASALATSSISTIPVLLAALAFPAVPAVSTALFCPSYASSTCGNCGFGGRYRSSCRCSYYPRYFRFPCCS
ncbi:Retrotrans-gag domain containing protein [Pyrenophora tritici-repentis]|nr:Retrotrans-gag domain containing protein [Pyrenophora tritici-repentis]